MSATRRLALVLTLVLVTVAMTAAAALAQGGSPNPSGGTSGCLPGLEERVGSIDFGDFLPRGFSIDLGARSWLNGFAISRYVVLAASRRVSERTLTAVAPRRVWAR